MVFVYEGIQASQAAIAAVIVGLEPVLIALWAALLLGERLTSKRAAGLSIGLVGALLVAGVGTDTPHILGLVFLLGMGLCWGWYTVAGKALMSEFSPVELIAAVSIMGALWAVTPGVISAVWLNGWTSPGGEQWIALLYLSVVNSVLAYLLWNFALVRLPAAMVGTSLYIQPILGATLSWLFLSERLPRNLHPRRSAGDDSRLDRRTAGDPPCGTPASSTSPKQSRRGSPAASSLPSCDCVTALAPPK